jgi:hypothetical protein
MFEQAETGHAHSNGDVHVNEPAPAAAVLAEAVVSGGAAIKGAVSKALMNGTTSGAALVSTGLRVAAAAAGVAVEDGDDAKPAGCAESALGDARTADQSNEEHEAADPNVQKPKLQFGTVDDHLVNGTATNAGE